MQEGKTIWLELAYFHPVYKEYYYDTVQLPAKSYEIMETMQKLRVEKITDPAIEITILQCEGLPTFDFVRLDTTSVPELDYLAQRMSELDDAENVAYLALVMDLFNNDEAGIIRVKDLINMTYHLEKIPVIQELWNDVQLGEYIIENDMHPDISKLPERSKRLIDRTALGREWREAENGLYAQRCYVATKPYQMPEIYDGIHLPLKEAERSFVFGFEITAALKGTETELTDEPEWIYLPMKKQKADESARKYGEASITDCPYLGFVSSIPQITKEILCDLRNFEKYNMLAARISLLSLQEQTLFKAILSAEQPSSIDEILDITENICAYEFAPSVYDADGFFKEYLSHHLDTRFDRAWLKQESLYRAGKELLEKLGASITGYGAVSARGRRLYELVSYGEENAEVQEQGPEEETDVEVGMKM